MAVVTSALMRSAICNTSSVRRWSAANPEHAASIRTMRFESAAGRDLPGGLRVVEANTRRTRLLGLARLDDLPATLALHITPCRSVHTVGMRFALDLIWLDRDGRVVRVDLGVAPRRV